MLSFGTIKAHLEKLSDGFLFDPAFIDMESSDVIAVEARYHMPAFSPTLFAKLAVPRPDTLSRAVPKRQAEYLAGRLLAKVAMELLGLPAVPIAIGKHRAPIWPSGLTGSISHSHGRCFCAITMGENTNIGIDIEQIATGCSLEAILEITLDTTERILVSRQRNYSTSALASAVFSAKESLFKALFPVVGVYFDFGAARLAGVNSRNELCLELTCTLHASLPEKKRFVIRFSISNGFVRTWLIWRKDKSFAV